METHPNGHSYFHWVQLENGRLAFIYTEPDAQGTLIHREADPLTYFQNFAVNRALDGNQRPYKPDSTTIRLEPTTRLLPDGRPVASGRQVWRIVTN